MLGPLSPPIDIGNLAGSLANFIEQVTPKDFFLRKYYVLPPTY